MYSNFADYEISITTPKKKNFSKLFFPSISGKNLSFEIFSRKFPKFFIFSLQLMKNYENSVTKNYPDDNASREKTVEAARLKMFESIDKSLSELQKKTANQTKAWFLSYIDSKKRIFPRRRAHGVAPTVSIF